MSINNLLLKHVKRSGLLSVAISMTYLLISHFAFDVAWTSLIWPVCVCFIGSTILYGLLSTAHDFWVRHKFKRAVLQAPARGDNEAPDKVNRQTLLESCDLVLETDHNENRVKLSPNRAMDDLTREYFSAVNEDRKFRAELAACNWQNFIEAAAKGNMDYLQRALGTERNKDSRKKKLADCDVNGNTPAEEGPWRMNLTRRALGAVRDTPTRQAMLAAGDENDRPYAALHMAVENNHIDVAALLLHEAGDDLFRGMMAADHWRMFIWATEQGCLDIVRRALGAVRDNPTRQAMLAAGDEKGRPYAALHMAVENNHIDVVELLFHEADDDLFRGMMAADHWRMFIWATEQGCLDIVRRAMLTASDKNDRPYAALHMAVENNHIDVVELLLHEADDDTFQGRMAADHWRMFIWATEQGCLDIVRRAIETAPDNASCQSMLAAVDDDGDEFAALHGAMENGHIHVAELLLKEADERVFQDMVSGGNWYAFVWAARQGYVNLVQRALDTAGNDATRQEMLRAGGDTEFECAAFTLAIQSRKDEVVKTLLKAADDATYQVMMATDDWYGFVQAAKHGHIDMVQGALNTAADDATCQEMLRARGGNRAFACQAFFYAAKKNHLEIVKTLLKAADDDTYQAMIATDNWYGFVWAARHGFIDIIQRVLDAKANDAETCREILTSKIYNLNTNCKYTALCWAAENDHRALVKLLLERSPDDKTKHMMLSFELFKPLRLASKRGEKHIAILLIESIRQAGLQAELEKSIRRWNVEDRTCFVNLVEKELQEYAVLTCNILAHRSDFNRRDRRDSLGPEVLCKIMDFTGLGGGLYSADNVTHYYNQYVDGRLKHDNEKSPAADSEQLEIPTQNCQRRYSTTC